jgi:hypothetical protein
MFATLVTLPKGLYILRLLEAFLARQRRRP